MTSRCQGGVPATPILSLTTCMSAPGDTIMRILVCAMAVIPALTDLATYTHAHTHSALALSAASKKLV